MLAPLNTGSRMNPQQWRRLLSACEYYDSKAYEWLDAPWIVGSTALSITKPDSIPLGHSPHISSALRGYLVASAEQSFLQLQLDVVQHWNNGHRDMGRYVTLTPCFRNEPRVDELHHNAFAKVELIDFGRMGHLNQRGVFDMVDTAVEFFSRYLTIDVINNTEPNAGEFALDIISRRGRIELGSYGLREQVKVGKWLYGTGCAEPRLTQAMQKEIELGGEASPKRE